MARPKVCARLCFALALLATRASAENEPETARLVYVANGIGARCPDEESFRHQVAARLGYQPFTPDGKHRVAVTLTIAGRRVRGHAEVLRSGQTAAGVRDLDGELDKCEPLTSALATAVAIALDPVRSAQPAGVVPPSPPSPTGDPPPPPARLPETPVAPPPPASSTSQTRKVLFGSAGVLGAVGLMPGAAVGADLGVGLRFEAVSVELSGRVETMPGSVRTDSGDRLEATALSALLAPCVHLGRWIACGSGRLGSLQGRAPDVVQPNLGKSLFGAVGARAGYVLPLSPVFALRGIASADLLVVRTSLLIDGAAVWTAPPVAAGLELGVVVSVP